MVARWRHIICQQLTIRLLAAPQRNSYIYCNILVACWQLREIPPQLSLFQNIYNTMHSSKRISESLFSVGMHLSYNIRIAQISMVVTYKNPTNIKLSETVTIGVIPPQAICFVLKQKGLISISLQIFACTSSLFIINKLFWLYLYCIENCLLSQSVNHMMFVSPLLWKQYLGVRSALTELTYNNCWISHKWIVAETQNSVNKRMPPVEGDISQSTLCYLFHASKQYQGGMFQ